MNLPDHAREDKAAWEAEAANYVEPAHELYAPDGAEPTRYDWMTVEWARRWPIEDLWTARLSDAAPR